MRLSLETAGHRAQPSALVVPSLFYSIIACRSSICLKSYATNYQRLLEFHALLVVLNVARIFKTNHGSLRYQTAAPLPAYLATTKILKKN